MITSAPRALKKEYPVPQLAIHGGKKCIPDGTLKDWPPIDDIDRKLVMASLENPNHSFGPNCIKLQEEFAAWNGNKFAITTNSGTAALHMAVAAVGLGAGDHVLVTAYSWSSSATCALHHDAIPVFVDIDYDTMNVDPRKIEAAITPQTKAIIVVHLHGLAVDMDAVLAIARQHKLKVIEDACQAHGATFKGQKVGTFGDCAAFSLNQNKTLCGGEGGIFVTNDPELHQRALQVWSFGETRTPSESRDYHAYALGWMYRNSDLNAAFARAQLSKLDRYIEVQRANTAIMLSELKDLPGLGAVLPTEPQGFRHNWYNVNLRIIPEHFDLNPEPFADAAAGNKTVAAFRERFVAALQAEGVRVGMWQRFILPAMTVFQAKNAYGHGAPWSYPWTGPVDYNVRNFPVAQAHTDRHICLAMPQRAPNGPEVARLVAAAVRKVFENAHELRAAAAAR